MTDVRAELTVLTGTDAGKRITLTDEEVTLGRAPESDLRFDPVDDLTVSGSHAGVYRVGEGWMIRDLESLNGTFVNGEKISGPVSLRHQDRIQLGSDGPLVEFRLLSSPALVETQMEALRMTSETGETRRRVASRRLWTMVAFLVLTLAGVTALAVHSLREGRLYRAQALAMQEQIDSILEASSATALALEGRIQGLDAALAESREALQGVRRDLEVARRDGNSAEVEALRLQLQEAQAAVVRYQLAAELDFEAIEAANRRAVAKVFVDFGDEVVTATAFAVESNGTLLTSRHVVAGPSGTQTPSRLAVQFADSRQIWPARILATSPGEELALLKAENIVGDVPTIQGLNLSPDTIQTGQGVAIIGFPLGGPSMAEAGQGILIRPTLTAGVVGAFADDVLQVSGFGVEGSSGSPVMDSNGEVIGVLFGGRIENGERTLFAVPTNRAAAFLERVR
jgi:pSer/pThr/pTyr-binding forkhead associated (FHA) protein